MVIEGMRYVLHTPAMVERMAQIMRERVQRTPISVDVRAWVPVKTRRQRDYLHALIRECARHLRCDEATLKEDLKRDLGIVEVAPSLVTGERVARVIPTESYSREQMTAFITAIEAWAAVDQGIALTLEPAEWRENTVHPAPDSGRQAALPERKPKRGADE